MKLLRVSPDRRRLTYSPKERNRNESYARSIRLLTITNVQLDKPVPLRREVGKKLINRSLKVHLNYPVTQSRNQDPEKLVFRRKPLQNESGIDFFSRWRCGCNVHVCAPEHYEHET